MRDREIERVYERLRGAARSPPRRGGGEGEREIDLEYDLARRPLVRGAGEGDLEYETERDREREDVLALRRMRVLSLRTGDLVRDRERDRDREYDGDREYERDLDLEYERPRLAGRSPRGRGERDREYDRDDPV